MSPELSGDLNPNFPRAERSAGWLVPSQQLTPVRRVLSFILMALFVAVGVPAAAQPFLVAAPDAAPQYGVYEVRLRAERVPENPHEAGLLTVRFQQPGGSSVTAEGFYDGDGVFTVRAYCREPGEWRWTSASSDPQLNAKSGSFVVKPSGLKGKLKVHPEDPYQFARENGEWFLHIGDTGYRYVVASEPHWREYIDQAAQMGATKIRTWFAQSRGNVEALFDEKRQPALSYWQEIDSRVRYALDRHPDVMLQLIPYAEDTDELKRYAAGDEGAKDIARLAQARWSAFPNVQWVISNDREVVKEGALAGRKILASTIDAIGRDMAAREPWGTLISNHQSRFRGYDFLDSKWSQFVTLEDMDQVDGKILLDYRKKVRQPIVNDEDRYEWHRNPANDRYFFRRLMWASLLSGGHATYGGLRTFEPYDGGPLRGVQGYFDANEAGTLDQGAHDFRHIHSFFRESGLTMVGFDPSDAACGGEPLRFKCAKREGKWIVYMANPDGDKAEADSPAAGAPALTIALGDKEHRVRWFNPRTGEWHEAESVRGDAMLKAPQPISAMRFEDWVLLIEPL